MPKEEKPVSLPCVLKSRRRIRQYSEREIRTYEVGDVVELPHEEALYLIASGLADGVSTDASISKGTADNEAAPKKSSKGKEKAE